MMTLRTRSLVLWSQPTRCPFTPDFFAKSIDVAAKRDSVELIATTPVMFICDKGASLLDDLVTPSLHFLLEAIQGIEVQLSLRREARRGEIELGRLHCPSHPLG